MNSRTEQQNQEILDDLVDDCLSRRASEINNQGKKEQILFLIEDLGVDEFLEEFVARRAQ